MTIKESMSVTLEPTKFELTRDIAKQYLTIYNAPIDWDEPITQLRDNLKRFSGDAKTELQKRLACGILLPYYEKNTIQDPPQNLLFYCHKWSQYTSRDWLAELQAVIEKNEKIAVTRAKCLELGFIHQLEFNPNSRQAFNWLFEHSEKSGDMNEGNREFIAQKLKNLVYAYGGAAICSVFMKKELEYKIKKLLNWRSGYFFEQLIYEIYNEDELIKIKSHELKMVRNVDPSLIKKIRPKE